MVNFRSVAVLPRANLDPKPAWTNMCDIHRDRRMNRFKIKAFDRMFFGKVNKLDWHT